MDKPKKLPLKYQKTKKEAHKLTKKKKNMQRSAMRKRKILTGSFNNVCDTIKNSKVKKFPQSKV